MALHAKREHLDTAVDGEAIPNGVQLALNNSQYMERHETSSALIHWQKVRERPFVHDTMAFPFGRLRA